MCMKATHFKRGKKMAEFDFDTAISALVFAEKIVSVCLRDHTDSITISGLKGEIAALRVEVEELKRKSLSSLE